MPVDTIQPMYFVNLLVGITLALCVGFVAFNRDRNLCIWAMAFSLYPIAFAIFGYRSLYPLWISVLFGNAALALMFALFIEGLTRLNNLRVHRLLIWGPVPVAMVGYMFLLDSLEGRLVFGTMLTTYNSVLAIGVGLMGIKTDRGRGKWIVFVAIMSSSVTFLIRAGLLAQSGTMPVNFLIPGVPQTVLLSVGMIWLIMFAIGMLVSYKERAESVMLRLALRDPLTQLGNRRVLSDRLIAAYEYSRVKQLYGAFMVLGLDFFKSLNDSQGYDLRNQLLIEIAYRLKDSVNDTDTVVRLGGDEFAVLIEGLDGDYAQALGKAQMVADRVLAKLTKPYRLQSHDMRTGDSGRIIYSLFVSIGVDMFLGHEKDNEMLFRNADKAMYVAKDSGGNRVVFCNETAPRLIGVA